MLESFYSGSYPDLLARLELDLVSPFRTGVREWLLRGTVSESPNVGVIFIQVNPRLVLGGPGSFCAMILRGCAHCTSLRATGFLKSISSPKSTSLAPADMKRKKDPPKAYK